MFLFSLETKQVNLKEFIGNMMSNTEGFSQNLCTYESYWHFHGPGGLKDFRR